MIKHAGGIVLNRSITAYSSTKLLKCNLDWSDRFDQEKEVGGGIL